MTGETADPRFGSFLAKPLSEPKPLRSRGLSVRYVPKLRFERRGHAGDVALVDDYAHLPTEVEAALAAARSLEPARLVAVFQPHRYSRTEQLWSTFAN